VADLDEGSQGAPSAGAKNKPRQRRYGGDET
jgi:hypothetical protein